MATKMKFSKKTLESITRFCFKELDVIVKELEEKYKKSKNQEDLLDLEWCVNNIMKGPNFVNWGIHDYSRDSKIFTIKFHGILRNDWYFAKVSRYRLLTEFALVEDSAPEGVDNGGRTKN